LYNTSRTFLSGAAANHLGYNSGTKA
jgi:hypothetical protein